MLVVILFLIARVFEDHANDAIKPIVVLLIVV